MRPFTTYGKSFDAKERKYPKLLRPQTA